MTNRRYTLTEEEIDIELGKGADPNEVSRQADKISSKWNIPSEVPSHPTLLLLGGFQGSGKTTTLESLQSVIDFLLISPDEIRFNLFQEQVPFSSDFTRLVNGTKFELLRRALESGANIVIDQALFPDRILLIEDLLQDFSTYRLQTAFLYAPKEVLVTRVTERQDVPGRYRGKVNELEASIQKYEDKFGAPNLDHYTLSIDTSVNTIDEVVSSIKTLFIN